VADALSRDLNLPILSGKPPGRRLRTSFSFAQHLDWALEARSLGHYFFEQVYAADAQGESYRLRKLAPRPPITVEDIDVARDGGLVSITQGIDDTRPIPVNRLVAYVWNPEPGSWVGRSELRALYKHWLIKDRLYRVDAIKHERNGVGMPIMEAPENATAAQIREYDQMAQEFKSGERGGGAIAHGARLRLVGTEGTLPDTIASIRQHDEAMARAFLAMFIQLGHTESGSRALGETFVDFFALSLQTIATWFADTFTAHVIEDWVDVNFGEEEPAPRLGFDPGPNDISVDPLAKLIDSGALVVDQNLRSWVRDRYGLPESAEPESTGPVEPPPLPVPAPSAPVPEPAPVPA
jgi:hypothetical protein